MTAIEQLEQRMQQQEEKKMTVEEAVDGLIAASKGQTLGEGLTIRELIEDGRRF